MHVDLDRGCPATDNGVLGLTAEELEEVHILMLLRERERRQLMFASPHAPSDRTLLVQWLRQLCQHFGLQRSTAVCGRGEKKKINK